MVYAITDTAVSTPQSHIIAQSRLFFVSLCAGDAVSAS